MGFSGCTKKDCDSSKGESKSIVAGTEQCVPADDKSAKVSIIASDIAAVGYGLAMDSKGSFYYPDLNNRLIRKISPTGEKSVFATGIDANALVFDADDNLYCAPWTADFVKKISPNGTVTNIASVPGNTQALAIDSAKNLFLTASLSHEIRRIAADGTQSVFAGSTTAGYVNGSGTAARFQDPQGLTIDAAGNLLVVDAGNHVIRKITAIGEVSTLAGSGAMGTENGPMLEASFIFRAAGSQPNAIAVTSAGVIYVGQRYGHGILRVISSDGLVSNYCGNGTDLAIAGPCSGSGFYATGVILVNGEGALFVGGANNDIVKISPPNH